MHFLSMSLLGSFQVTMDGVDVDGFEYNKVKGLLAYLAVESDRAHHRELLAEILWPDRPAQMARNSLRQALSILRNAIYDREAEVPFLIITRDTVQFNKRSDTWLDVDVFTDSITACRESLRRGADQSVNTCIHWFRQCARLYRGDFLDQFVLSDSAQFSEWINVKRQEYRRQASDVFALLASHYEKLGEYDEALNYVSRQVAIDRTSEEAHRMLMRIYYQKGDRNAALAQYETCRSILESELGVKPEEVTAILYEKIRAREVDLQVDTHIATGGADKLTRPHYIPLETTPLIGREKDVAGLKEMIEREDCRFVTIVGPGGIGKTRLAQRLASEQLEVYRDGVFFIPLAHLSSAEFIAPAVVETLNPVNFGEDDLISRLPGLLRDKEMLLVFDNFEHLLEGNHILDEILKQSPGIRIIATSREKLGISGEWIYEPGGLRYPESDTDNNQDSYSAVQLFVRTAHRFRSDFTLTEEDRLHVSRICRMLEGNPLAIELAASWVRLLKCDEIVEEIDKSLDFLEGAPGELPERHRSLRAVFRNSWTLLSEKEREIFSALSVFRGGFTRDAAETVASARLPDLASLVGKSLIVRNLDGRYEIHEILRQYASEMLEESGSESGKLAHMKYFMGFAEKKLTSLNGPDQVKVLEEIENEIPNLRKAWEMGVRSGDVTSLEFLMDTMFRFYEIRGWHQEGEETLGSALASLVSMDEPQAGIRKRVIGLLYSRTGAYQMRRGHLVGAAESFSRAVQKLQDAGTGKDLAELYSYLGILHRLNGEHVKARSLLEKSLSLYIRNEYDWGMAESLRHLGNLHLQSGDVAQARQILGESLELYRKTGDRRGIALALDGQGKVSREIGNSEDAISLFRESLTIKEEIQDRRGIAETLGEMGALEFDRVKFDEAESFFNRSLSLMKESGDEWGSINMMIRLGNTRQNQGDRIGAKTMYLQSLMKSRELQIEAGSYGALLGLAQILESEGKDQDAYRICIALQNYNSANGERREVLEQLVDDLRSRIDEAEKKDIEQGMDATIETLIKKLEPAFG